MEPDPDYDRILSAMHAVDAPDGLRRRIAAERDRTATRRLVVKRMKLTGGLAAVAAALGIVVGLASSGDRVNGPSALEAAALSSRGPVSGPPRVSAEDPRRLQVRVGGVPFPTWSGQFPWRASGQRTDMLEGRRTATVYYDGPADARLGYTIVDGDALPWPEDGRTVVRDGVEIHVARREGRVVAFWREHGHTCVISAPESVPADRIVTLATSDDYLS